MKKVAGQSVILLARPGLVKHPVSQWQSVLLALIINEAVWNWRKSGIIEEMLASNIIIDNLTIVEANIFLTENVWNCDQ